MKKKIIVTILQISMIYGLVFCNTTLADAIEFTLERSLFYSMHNNLEVETFENASVDINSTEVFVGPINSLTNNAVFLPGNILENIEIRTLQRTSFSHFDSSQFIALGSSIAGLQSKSIAINQYEIGTDKISLYFNNSQTDVGFGISSIELRSNTFLDASMMVDIFSDASDERSRLGGIFVNTTSPGIMSFLGISSEIPFNRIDLVSLTAYSSPVIDDLAFNAMTPIPEPATMFLFGTCIAGLAATRLKRKKK